MGKIFNFHVTFIYPPPVSSLMSPNRMCKQKYKVSMYVMKGIGAAANLPKKRQQHGSPYFAPEHTHILSVGKIFYYIISFVSHKYRLKPMSSTLLLLNKTSQTLLSETTS